MSLPVLPADEWQVRGLIASASNATLQVRLGDELFVYKPISGERPLWDFPEGSLAAREVAAYRVSESLGWALVPETGLAVGPYGPGMLQRWVEWSGHPVDVFAPNAVPAGWLPVAGGLDADDHEVVLAHEDGADLRRVALFDVIVNNADRKGGHLLLTPQGLRGIDHGLCFHVHEKLRTVVWGFAGSALGAGDLAHVAALRAGLQDGSSDLSDLLPDHEVAAITRRLTRLSTTGVFPAPSGHGPTFPWPPM